MVLVVDPDPVRAKEFTELITEQTRYELRVLGGAKGALEFGRGRPVDALIAAHGGGVDGVGLAAELKALDAELVVFLTVALGDDEARAEALDAVGAGGVISLPLTRTDLIARLDPAIQRRSLATELAQTRNQLQHAEGALRQSRRYIERTTRELAITHSELETATERLVEAEELAAVGRVVSGIAHEISSQLALVGYAEAIKSRVTDPELVEFADIIVAAQKRLSAMVDEIRDFVVGPRQIKREAADLVSAVNEALSIVRHDRGVRARNVEFRFAARPLVEIHRQKFSQVIINLISNSVLATGPGDTLRVEIDIDDDEDAAIIRVTDWGEGMSEAILERLGEPFFTTRGEKGSGLGVGICKRIAEDHGGSLTFESELGVGTTATLRLPVYEPEVAVG